MKGKKMELVSSFRAEELHRLIEAESIAERERLSQVAELLLGKERTVAEFSPELAEQLITVFQPWAKEGDGSCGFSGCC